MTESDYKTALQQTYTFFPFSFNSKISYMNHPLRVKFSLKAHLLLFPPGPFCFCIFVNANMTQLDFSFFSLLPLLLSLFRLVMEKLLEAQFFVRRGGEDEEESILSATFAPQICVLICNLLKAFCLNASGKHASKG